MIRRRTRPAPIPSCATASSSRFLDGDKLSGFISRFGDRESDKGQFLDQFFDKASLEGQRLRFKTKTVHGTWFEFSGTLTVNPDKSWDRKAIAELRAP